MAQRREGNPEGITWAHNPVDFPLGPPSSTQKGRPMAKANGNRRRGKDGRFLPTARGRGSSTASSSSRGGSRGGSGGGAGSRSGGTRGASSRGDTKNPPAARAQPAGAAKPGGGAKNARSTALARATKNPPRGGETATQVLAAAGISAIVISYKSRLLDGAPAILDAGSDIGIGFLLRSNMAAKVPYAGEYMHLAGNFILGLGAYKAVRILAGGYVDKAAAYIPAPKLIGTSADDAAAAGGNDNLGEYVELPGLGFNGYPDIMSGHFN